MVVIVTQYFFFDSNKIVSKHNIFLKNQYFDPSSYRDENEELFIEYKYNTGYGTGFYSNTIEFYKYRNNKFINVLNYISNKYSDIPYYLHYKINSYVLSTNPLKIKFNYTYSTDYGRYNLVKDSTIVNFKWDENSLSFKPKIDSSNKDKRAYAKFVYLETQDDLVFLNGYYDNIIAALRESKNNGNIGNKAGMLVMLNAIMREKNINK